MGKISKVRAAIWLVAVSTVSALFASAFLWLPLAEAANDAGSVVSPEVVKWGVTAAAAATGLSSLAAGYAVAAVGSAGMGALAERPELLGRVLVLVGLAEGIAIYGLIVSILILNRIA